jgi:hypothetical protein
VDQVDLTIAVTEAAVIASEAAAVEAPVGTRELLWQRIETWAACGLRCQ